jgi:hypothetical protein
MCPGDPQPGFKQLSSSDATMPFTEGPPEQQAKYRVPDPIHANHLPDETGLLSLEHGLSPAPHRCGIIGKGDRTFEPMIPAGSIVHIDTRERANSSRRSWRMSSNGLFISFRPGPTCVAGVNWTGVWNSEWLTLIPHPMSHASSRRWKYRIEVESLGRLVAVAIRLTE